MPTENWTRKLTWGCSTCLETNLFKHKFSCPRRTHVPLDGPGHLLLYWYLTIEIDEDHNDFMSALNNDAQESV